MLRVIAGELRGRRIEAPPARSPVRPTGDRVRESLFALLGDLEGLRVLDLFCGTGALGIEALSRGASRAVLVDRDPGLAERNVSMLGLGERAEVVRADARRYLRALRGRAGFDLVLCDPPWSGAGEIIGRLESDLLTAVLPGGRIVVESAVRDPVSLSLEPVDERRYGETLLRIHAVP